MSLLSLHVRNFFSVYLYRQLAITACDNYCKVWVGINRQHTLLSSTSIQEEMDCHLNSFNILQLLELLTIPTMVLKSSCHLLQER